MSRQASGITKRDDLRHSFIERQPSPSRVRLRPCLRIQLLPRQFEWVAAADEEREGGGRADAIALAECIEGAMDLCGFLETTRQGTKQHADMERDRRRAEVSHRVGLDERV